MEQGFALLKSAKPSVRERKTLLGREPAIVYSGGPGDFSWEKLRALCRQRFAIGFLSYDLAEGLLGLARGQGPLPGFWFGFYDSLACLDELTGRCFAWEPDGTRAPEQWPRLGAPGRFSLGFTGFDQGRSAYRKNILDIREHIGAGDFYQVNYTIRGRFGFRDDPWGLFSAFIRRQPVPYAAYIQMDEGTVLSGSPELFLRVRGNRACSAPMKGTARAGPGGRRRLGLSGKDRAENLMITDLVRNDLGRVASSVNVRELFRVERYATVFQMVSMVEAELLPGHDFVDALAACFPAGSVTGAPKSSATEAIARLERSPRGVYTGAIGYITPWGDSCWSVAIRTCELRDSELVYGTGGGITFASDPDAEWEECMAKMAGLTGL